MTSRDLTISVLIWVLLLGMFGAFGVFVLDWPEYRYLAHNAVETTGKVTAKEPSNHRAIRYSYQVDGQMYSGIGNAGRGNPEFDQLEIGSPLKVYYDPNDPGKSLLGNPTEQWNSLTRGVIFLALAGSVLCLAGLYSKGWLPIAKHSRT